MKRSFLIVFALLFFVSLLVRFSSQEKKEESIFEEKVEVKKMLQSLIINRLKTLK